MRTGLILVLLLMPLSLVFADYVDPTAKTNVNVQSDLFRKSVGDVRAFEGGLEADKNKAVMDLNDPKNVEALSGKSRSEVEREARSLEAIKPLELNSKGRAAMISNPDLQEMFVDETRPAFAAHARDAKTIAEASGNFLGRLTDKLRELGVDCRTVKGNREVEPDYRIEVRQEVLPKGDTKYNKHMCEELRNKYSCTDSLKLTCKRREMKWEAVSSRFIDLDGPDIYWHYSGWVYSQKLYRRHFRYFVYQVPYVMESIRSFIAQRLGVSVDQIVNVRMESSSGFGRVIHMTEKGYIFEFFRVWYGYREGKMECVEWSEDWTETCRLQ